MCFRKYVHHIWRDSVRLVEMAMTVNPLISIYLGNLGTKVGIGR